jgi:integrase
MSKDFVQIANDVMTGVGLLRQGAPDTIKAFAALSTLDKASGVTNWTLHDLRRTFATHLAALRTPIHVTERLLNHISGTTAGIVSVYQRHSFMPEMREAVAKYETHLAALLETKSALTARAA